MIAAVAGLSVIVGLGAGVAAESGQQLYLLNCWGCHRQGGEGIPGTAPSLIGAADFLRVPGGRAYLAEVPGVSESALDDAQVAEVLNWILYNFSTGKLPADFRPYSAREIGGYRHHRLTELSKTRQALLDQMTALRPRPREH